MQSRLDGIDANVAVNHFLILVFFLCAYLNTS